MPGSRAPTGLAALPYDWCRKETHRTAGRRLIGRQAEVWDFNVLGAPQNGEIRAAKRGRFQPRESDGRWVKAACLRAGRASSKIGL